MEGVLRDVESSGLGSGEKALFRFLDKVNGSSSSIEQQDIDRVKQAGWTDEAIYDAVTVCAMFNFFNRWIDATGVHAMTDEAHRAAAKRMARDGYIRTIKK